MKTIHKYELGPLGVGINVPLPKGSVVLSAGIKNTDIFIWALVDTEQPTEVRQFIAYGTGWEVDEDIGELCFIDTVFEGPYVWHVFEVA